MAKDTDISTPKTKRMEPLSIIKACVVIVVGVLFCLSFTMSATAMSNSLGVGLIAVGAAYCILSVFKEKSLLTTSAFGGLAAAALGIYVISVNAIEALFNFVPYILIAYGVLLFADSFMGKFWRQADNSFVFACKLVFGVGAIIVGVLLLTVESFADYAIVVLGAVFVVLGFYAFFKSFSRRPKETD